MTALIGLRLQLSTPTFTKTRKELGKKIVPFHRPFSVYAKTHLVTCDSLNERSDIEVYCEFFLLQCLTILMLKCGFEMTPR